MRLITKKTIALTLLTLFIGGLVLPIPHILETDSTGRHSHCSSADCGSKGKNSHSQDTCAICQHVLFATKSAQIQTTQIISAVFTADFTAPIYKQPIIRLFTTENNPLRAPPCSL